MTVFPIEMEIYGNRQLSVNLSNMDWTLSQHRYDTAGFYEVLSWFELSRTKCVWCAVITAQEWTVKLLYNKLLYALSLNNPVNKLKNLNYRYPSYALITHTFWELTSEVKVSCAPIALLFSYFCWNCEFELSISHVLIILLKQPHCVCVKPQISICPICLFLLYPNTIQ